MQAVKQQAGMRVARACLLLSRQPDNLNLSGRARHAFSLHAVI